MRHLKLLTVIVLSFAGQICRSMPYVPEDLTNPTRFRCNCLLKALTHMRLTWMLFGLKKVSAASILDTVVDSDGNDALSILYKLNGVKIGSLWLFQLYTGLLRSYYVKDLKNKSGRSRSHEAGLDRNISEVHSYVIDLMLSDWNATDCPTYRLDDWFLPWFDKHRDALFSEIEENVEQNNREFRNLVKTKKKLMNTNTRQVVEELSESFNIKYLLLNELGDNTLVKKALMNSYNVHVDSTSIPQFEWHDFADILTSSWKLAINVTWPEDHLQNLKSYLTKHINFLKIIFLRFTLVHLLLIEKLETGPMKHYARKWHTLLTYFGQMLHIEDDPVIKHLLTVFDKLANPDLGVGAVIDDLNKLLHNCVVSFKRNATNPMDQTTVKKGLLTATSSEHKLVELITQKKTNRFLSEVELIFKRVNFGVVRSLVEYIDELDETVKRKVLEEPSSSYS